MKPLRFAHLADLHLDTPFKGIREAQPDLARRLQDASLEAWDMAVAACIRERVDFVVIAGDVYDSDQAGVRAQLRFLFGLRALSEKGIPTFIVHGNHDPGGGRWTAISEWPAGVTVFGPDGVQVAPVERDGETIALVHGISYGEQHVNDNLARLFKREPDELFQVGVLHCSVGDHPEHGRYAPCSLDDLERANLDYWALGHIHARRVLQVERPTVVYPGNLQARHPNEPGAKGFYLVEVAPSGAATLAFQAADCWRFERIEVDLGDGEVSSLPDLQDLLVDRAAKLADEHDGRGLILRAEVLGSSELHAELRRAGADGILETLRDASGPELWWDDLQLATRPPFDRDARMRTGDFLADLLRRRDVEGEQAEELVSALSAELGRNGKVKQVARDVDLRGLQDDIDDLWDEAERLAVDFLDELEAERQ